MAHSKPGLRSLVREWPLAASFGLLGVMTIAWSSIARLLEHPATLIGLLALLCAVILFAAVAIVRHADVLAHRMGEPGGTLLLTLAVTGLEVAMVGFSMATGEEKPTLARDTMFAVVMLVINGFMGLALLFGGLRHGTQSYNLKGANAFLVLILPLAILGLVLPNFTRATKGPTLSTAQMIALSIMSVAVYGIFLYVQNRRHRGFFTDPDEAEKPERAAGDTHADSTRSNAFHIAMLIAFGLPLVLLAKELSTPMDALVRNLNAPIALGGFIVAALVLTPESIAAVRAARNNQLQRSVNILLGSILASIGLTIPLVIAVSLFTGRGLILGIDPAEMVLLALSLVTAMLTFALPRTHLLTGCVHLLLFCVYAMLIFDV